MAIYASTVSWRRSVPGVVMVTWSSWQRRGSDACALDVVSTPIHARRRWRKRCNRTRTCSVVTRTCWTTRTERVPAERRVTSPYLTATCSAPDLVSLSSPRTSRLPTSASPVNETQLPFYHYSSNFRTLHFVECFHSVNVSNENDVLDVKNKH